MSHPIDHLYTHAAAGPIPDDLLQTMGCALWADRLGDEQSLITGISRKKAFGFGMPMLTKLAGASS